MSFYRSLEIRNFRGIQDLHLDDLGRINLISGLNDVGKSSVLEAIFLNASGALAGQNALRAVNPGRKLPLVMGVGPGAHNGPWDSLFRNLDTSVAVELNGVTAEGVYSIRLSAATDGQSIDLSGAPDSSTEGKSQSQAGLAIEERRGDRPPVLYRQSAKIEVERRGAGATATVNFTSTVVPEPSGPFKLAHFIRGEVGPNIAEGYSKMRLERASVTLVEALQLVDSRIKGLEVLAVDGESTLHADLGAGPMLPLNLLGDGVTTVARYVVALAEAKGGALLLDEIGTGVHHSLLPDLWRMLNRSSKRLDVQIFATTHSDEAIRAAVAGLGKDDNALRLFRLWRDSSGEITASAYGGAKMQAALDMNADLR